MSDIPHAGDAFLWPTRETDIGLHLLDRPLGSSWNRDVSGRSGRRCGDGPIPACRSPLTSLNTTAAEAMVEHWASLCFHTWPADEEVFLSEERGQAGRRIVRAHRGDAWADTACASAAVDRHRTSDQGPVDAVADALGVAPNDVTGEDPLGRVVARLWEPRFKASVLNAAQHRRVDRGTGP